jgi:hypothetical protein
MNTIKVVCTQCKKPFLRLKKQHEFAMKNGSKRILCSTKCQALSQVRFIKVKCLACKKPLFRKPGVLNRYGSKNIFCSHACANGVMNALRSGKNHPNWKIGKASYRRHAFKHYGEACTVCGYSVKEVLEVHHRNGNRSNNKIKNLDVLCPTHHTEFERGIRKY